MGQPDYNIPTSTSLSDKYQSPFSERYASKEMCYMFSDHYKFGMWRKLWIALAEAQKELGLQTITEEQINEMRQFQDKINFDVARKYEKKLRHDVVAPIHAYHEQCPQRTTKKKKKKIQTKKKKKKKKKFFIRWCKKG